MSTGVRSNDSEGAAILKREWWIVASLVAAIGFVLGAGQWTWRIDQTLYDAGLSLSSRDPSSDIVIVAIDDASLAAIGRWPWPRTVHATLIDTLAASGTRAIGLDLLLTEPDPDPARDVALADAIRRAGNVVLPVAFLGAPDGVREMLPAGPLRNVATLGHVDAELDADSILRAAYLRAGPGAPTYPHFALALLETAKEPPRVPPATAVAPPRTERTRAWLRDQRVLIRFAGAPGRIQRISFADLLRGNVAADSLRGKFVLIGATAIGVGDAFATPVSGRERPMPGIEISANLLNALRAGDTLHAVSPRWIGAAAALFAFGLLLAMQRLRPRSALAVSAVAALAAAPASLIALAGGIWIAPTTFIVVAVMAYPLWSWRRLEAASRYFERELVRLHADPAHPDTGRDFVARRIDALRFAANRLHAAQRLIAETLAALPEAVYVIRGDGTIEFANPRALALASAQHVDAVRGQPLARLLAAVIPQEAPTWSALFERAAASGATVVSEARSAALGDFLVRCAPLRGAETVLGNARGFVVALTDITRLKLAERQRDDVLGFVSHDIRSPQASLISLVELRRAGQLNLGEDALLAHVEDLARRSLELADEFVQVARAEAKPLALEDLDPDRLLDEALREICPQAQRKNVLLDRGAGGAPQALRGERLLLVRALSNLLSNAVKFSPAGATVFAGLVARDGYCVFSVRDHGPGIAQDDLARLFQRYQRVESGSMTRLEPGIGLGLVFVDAVSRRHGGRVAVESRVGEGSLFEVWIPLVAR